MLCLGVGEREAELGVGAAGEPVEAVDRLQPAGVVLARAPHARGRVRPGAEPAHQSVQRADAAVVESVAEVADVERAGGADRVDRSARRPGMGAPVP